MDDPAEEESEQLGTRHGASHWQGPSYGPTIGVESPPQNGYLKSVIAWASLVTSVLILIFAYLWTHKDATDAAVNERQDREVAAVNARQDAELMMLRAVEIQNRETISRMEAHLEYLQRQVDRLQP